MPFGKVLTVGIVSQRTISVIFINLVFYFEVFLPGCAMLMRILTLRRLFALVDLRYSSKKTFDMRNETTAGKVEDPQPCSDITLILEYTPDWAKHFAAKRG